MSGTNPFRRKDVTGHSSNDRPRSFVQAPVSGNAITQIQAIDTNLDRSAKTKVTKTVRIISPHSATSDDHDFTSHRPPKSSDGEGLSSSPESASIASSEDDAEEDPFELEPVGPDSILDDGTQRNTLQNTGHSRTDTVTLPPMPQTSFKGAPLTDLTSDQRTSNKSADVDVSFASAVTPKPQYDVERFKRLLLTGEKGSINPSIPSVPTVSFGRSPTSDSISNTDVSPVTRSNGLEADSNEFPRTSFEETTSRTEERPLGTDLKTVSPKSRPPEPKHRHGKLVTANLPQTVSFGDPALSITEITNPSNTTNPMTPRDQNEVSLSPTPPLDARSGLDREEHNASAKHHKRVPPIPPLARRQSGRRPPSSINDLNRSQGIPEVSTEENLNLPNAPAKSLNVPPPPPPRRSGMTRGESSSSLQSITSAATASDFTTAGEVQKPSSKARPPNIPSHSPTISASTASHRTSPSSGSPSAPPAPPPRRRGSSQSSYTPSRLSGDYRAMTERLRSDSGASSISQLQINNHPEAGTGTERKDVMADLTALQREVDELRGKMRE